MDGPSAGRKPHHQGEALAQESRNFTTASESEGGMCVLSSAASEEEP